MELTLTRTNFTDESTIGELFINGEFECYTLEDKVRSEKVKGLTAIPAGTYEIIVNFSERFQRQMPLLLNVPDFNGVRIHSGNTSHDTEGCILVGKSTSTDVIRQSKSTFDALLKKLMDAAVYGEITIQIS